MNLQTDLIIRHGLTPQSVLADHLWWSLAKARAWRRRAADLVADWPADFRQSHERLDAALRERRLLSEDELDLARDLSRRLEELADAEEEQDGGADEDREERAEALRRASDDLWDVATRLDYGADLQTAIRSAGL